MSAVSALTSADVRTHPPIDLVQPVLPTFSDLAPGIEEILRTGIVTKGRFLRKLESRLARHLGVRHAVGVSSCTTGLMLTYQGLGLSGEVIVPSFTFMATVSALLWAGAEPVFADVDPHTHNLDPEAVEAAISPRTTAIVAAHIFGNPADVGALEDIAERHGLRLVFDAAHGFGALYENRTLGRQGNAQCFSLSPTKLLIAGEGGIVATNDDALAEHIRVGREYGNSGDYDSAFAGFNARMSEINALMAIHSLEKLESAARRRNEVVDLYRDRLGRLPGIAFQRIRPGDRCSYKDFSITVDESELGLSRDQLAQELNRANIDTRSYYDPPVHRHFAYRRFGKGADLPNTERLARTSLSLPLWSIMDDETAFRICDAVSEACRRT